MVFIRKDNFYIGCINVLGKTYTFLLTLMNNSNKNQGRKGILSVDNKFYIDLRKIIINFINEHVNFTDPLDFYKQFNDYIQGNIKSKRTQIWSKNSSKIAVITKSLTQEIITFQEHMTQIDFKTQTITFEVSDPQFRIHKAVVKFSLNYKTDPIHVVSHNLPLQHNENKNNLGLDNTFTVADFFEKFLDLVNYFQSFWNKIFLIDSQCCVLDPIKPTFKDTYRRIKLTDSVSVSLLFNPLNAAQRPQIKLLGCQSDVNMYQNILQKNLEYDMWDDDGDLLFNLSNVLEVSIPSKVFEDESETKDLIKVEECAICFTQDLNDEIPNEMCENFNCKSVYHSSCLYTYLSSVPQNKNYFGKIQGECPNCDEIICCTVPKLL